VRPPAEDIAFPENLCQRFPPDRSSVPSLRAKLQIYPIPARPQLLHVEKSKKHIAKTVESIGKSQRLVQLLGNQGLVQGRIGNLARAAKFASCKSQGPSKD
jgi:hypothetical protein